MIGGTAAAVVGHSGGGDFDWATGSVDLLSFLLLVGGSGVAGSGHVASLSDASISPGRLLVSLLGVGVSRSIGSVPERTGGSMGCF